MEDNAFGSSPGLERQLLPWTLRKLCTREPWSARATWGTPTTDAPRREVERTMSPAGIGQGRGRRPVHPAVSRHPDTPTR